MQSPFQVFHHGGRYGVTGSCHEVVFDDTHSLLIDCGLMQGAALSKTADESDLFHIDFPLQAIQALLLTHCHIDHVGRIPYLLMAGYDQPVYCTEATAKLLPLVLEDALKIGITRHRGLIQSFLSKLEGLLRPTPYGKWTALESFSAPGQLPVQIRFQPAGHILGSAYIEIKQGQGRSSRKILFSGDLGAPYTPLLPAPKSPYSTDMLVLESTYGDRCHRGRRDRRKSLERLIEKCFENRGTVLIPAFSIGRTQELLYELEEIIHQPGNTQAADGIHWEDLDIIVDSPLASRFTEAYKELRSLWDQEAKKKVQQGRHPLSFDQILTLDTHSEHLATIEYLKKSGRPAIVIAASGMCSGGRILNYLKALIGDPRTDILFVGYQAQGTPGRSIQKYGPQKGWVKLEHKKYTIQAGVYTISGYSAHADQKNLLNFVKRMWVKPKVIRLVHGELEAREALGTLLNDRFPEISVEV